MFIANCTKKQTPQSKAVHISKVSILPGKNAVELWEGVLRISDELQSNPISLTKN